jgi:putative transposase
MTSFIDDHRDQYGVEPICEVLPIAPSTYYERKACEADPSRRSPRAQRDDELTVEIRRVWDANHSVYGAKKVWKQLKREGFEVARCTVERLMEELGLEGVTRGRASRSPRHPMTPHPVPWTWWIETSPWSARTPSGSPTLPT